MSSLSRLARLGLALCLPIWSSACGLRLDRPRVEPQRVPVVCAQEALDPCVVSRWLIPHGMSADQAGELALAERAEKEACAARQKETAKCITDHNEQVK